MRYTPSDYLSADLHILIHHIYEYRKGIRNMVLHTMDRAERQKAELLLSEKEICFYTQEVNERKINIFFGKPVCVDVVKSFGSKLLSDYTPEEDFILGVMLGYDTNMQCERYLKQLHRVSERLQRVSALNSSVICSNA